MQGKEILCYFILRSLLENNEEISISGKILEGLFQTDRKVKTRILNTLVQMDLIEMDRGVSTVSTFRLGNHVYNKLAIPKFLSNNEIPLAVKKHLILFYVRIDEYNNATMVKDIEALFSMSSDTVRRLNIFLQNNRIETTKGVFIEAKNSQVLQKKLDLQKVKEETKWSEVLGKTSELHFQECTKCKLVKTNNEYYRYSPRKCKSCCRATATERAHNIRRNNVTLEDDSMLFFSAKIMRSKVQAKARGILEYDLTPEHLDDVYNQQNRVCFYTGKPFDNTSKYSTVSIDRVDSSKGYIKGNVVLCHNIVNSMKSDMPNDVFLDYIVSIKDYTPNYTI